MVNVKKEEVCVKEFIEKKLEVKEEVGCVCRRGIIVSSIFWDIGCLLLWSYRC